MLCFRGYVKFLSLFSLYRLLMNICYPWLTGILASIWTLFCKRTSGRFCYIWLFLCKWSLHVFFDNVPFLTHKLYTGKRWLRLGVGHGWRVSRVENLTSSCAKNASFVSFPFLCSTDTSYWRHVWVSDTCWRSTLIRYWHV